MQQGIYHTDQDGKDMDSIDGGGGTINAISFALIGAGIATSILHSSDSFDNSSTLTSSSHAIAFNDEILTLGKALTQHKRPRGYEEHHIVPKAASAASYARKIVESAFPDGVENKNNKVLLPQSIHRRIHTNAYYIYINTKMFSASFQSFLYGTPLQKEVKEELADIKIMLILTSLDEY